MKETTKLITKNNSIIFLSILFFLSLITHFLFLGYPKEVVFDEVHFAGFSSKYFTGQYYFDNHPPLGKLLAALGGKIGGYDNYVEKYGDFDFSSIGNIYGKVPSSWFRFFHLLAGILLPLAIFLFLRIIKIKETVAFFIGVLIILDNALLVQSRFILVDMFMIFFGWLGLFLFFNAREKKYHSWLMVATGFSLGASIASKWFGASYLAVVLLIAGWDFLNSFLKIKSISNLLKKLSFKQLDNLEYKIKNIISATIFLLVSVASIYIFSFYIHFSLLPKFTSSDVPQGDLSFVDKFIELNKQCYYSHSGLTATHPDQSTPMEWVMLKKPVHYWTKSEGKKFAQINFFGNPILWIAGIFGVLYFPVFWKRIKLATEIKIALYAGFWINFLPFLFINRPIFLYHYLNAFIFSLILFVLVFLQLEEKNKKLFWSLLSLFIFLVVLGFIVFSPYTYGLALKEDDWRRVVANFFMY